MNPEFFRKYADLITEDSTPVAGGIKVYIIHWQDTIVLVTRDLDKAIEVVNNNEDYTAWVNSVGGDPMKLIDTYIV
jgi:hypothetical protein